MSGTGIPTKPPASAKRGAIISGVVTVAVLVAVIIGVAALSSPVQSKPQTTLGLAGAGDQAAQLADRAESALASGDTSAAVALATQALKTDPNNEAALSVITRARSARSSGGQSGSGNSSGGSSSGGSNGGGSSQDPDAGFTSKVSDMGALLPTSFNDYFLGEVTVTENESQVSATPLTAGQEANQVIWTVHQTRSKAEAQQFVTNVSRSLYANDQASLTVDGVRVYFGTDGTRFATAAYVRGVYAFEVLITSSGAGPPKDLKPLAQKAAAAFADAPPK